MGEQPSPYVIRIERIRATRMHPKWKAILWVMHTYADHRHACTCSERMIAKDTCYSRTVVQKCLAEMVDAGIISRTRRLKETDEGYRRLSDSIIIRMNSLARFNYQKWHARHSMTSEEVAARMATVAPPLSSKVLIDSQVEESKIIPINRKAVGGSNPQT